VTIPVSEIAQQRTIRLIPSGDYKPPVLRALVDTDAEVEPLAKLEGLTSKRLVAGVATAGFDFDAWGRTYISAAFTYRRKGGNRFNDENRGAWYAGFNDRTSLHEVAYHKTRELAFIDYFYDEVHYVALHASFIGRFHDIRNVEPPSDCLHPDITIGYPRGQAVANELLARGSRGLIYPSVRNPGGICIVAFQPTVVQDVAPGAHWKLTWGGTPNWTATTT
jgi:RES domain-containing protein